MHIPEVRPKKLQSRVGSSGFLSIPKSSLGYEKFMLTRLALRFRTTLPFPKQRVVDWHSRPGVHARLNPLWNRVKGIAVETHIDSVDEHTTSLEDRVQYVQPSIWLPVAWTERRLQKLFAYRHRLIANDLACVLKYPQAPLKLLVTGSTGLVGSELTAFLQAAGHSVLEVSRSKEQGPNTIWWDSVTGQIDLDRLEGLDGVFHLAGENIAGRWTETKKEHIRDSRIVGTLRLVEALSRLKTPPKTFLCASAIGYYGDQGATLLNEQAPSGSDFLANVCKDWETAANRYIGGRVASLRFGVILSPAGGALGKMLIPFRLGLGGRMGCGDQYMSWIGIDDVLYQSYHVLMTSSIQGPVNMVAPFSVTNKEFTPILGKILHRPTLLPIPAFAIRSIFGEMGQATMLASIRAQPAVLETTKSEFAYPTLDQALQHLLQ